MNRRAHEEVCGPCFLISEDQRPDADSGKLGIAEAAKPELELITAAFYTADRSSITNDELFEVTLPDEGWREVDSQGRFIQCSMEKNWFCMDMPLNSLHRARGRADHAETERVLLPSESAPGCLSAW